MVAKVKRIIHIISVGVVSLVPLLARPVYAASATLSLSPASSSVAQGSYLTLSVRENSGGEPVNAASFVLNYPTDKFDFVSIGSSSAFTVTAASSGGGGTVHVDRGALPAVSGLQTIATVRFKAKVNSGTASVTFASSDVRSANDNSNISAGGGGGTYTLTNAPPPTPEVPKDTTPPTIKDVKATNITTNTALITWTTSEPAGGEVDYGLNKAYGLAAVDSNVGTDHKVTLNSPLVLPGTLYHFLVKSSDPSGNSASSADAVFTTKGATLAIKVVDQKNKPVSGAKVSLNNQSGTTGKDGVVTLSGFPTGKLVGTVNYHGKQTVVSTQITSVDPSGKAQPVTFKINVTKNWLVIILVPLILILLLAAFVLGWEERGGGSGGWRGGLDELARRTRRAIPFLAPRGAINPLPTQPPNPAPQASKMTTPEPQIVKPNSTPKT